MKSDTQIPRVTLEQWRILHAVVEHGGFGPAAEALNRSQSSISYAIKQMQSQLPVPLLAQQGRRAVLTEAGEQLLQRIRPVLNDALDVERLAQTLSEGWESEVSLAVDMITPAELIFCALARFSEQAPQTRIRMIETALSGANEAMITRQADLALTGSVPPGMLGEPLLDIEFVAVAQRDHPLHRLGREITEADLRRHRQVVVRDTGQFRQVDSGWLGADQRWTVSHMRTSLAILKQGLAFAWLPRNLLDADLASGELVPLPLTQGQTRRASLYLVLADQSLAGPAARQLAELIKSQAKTLD